MSIFETVSFHIVKPCNMKCVLIALVFTIYFVHIFPRPKMIMPSNSIDGTKTIKPTFK